MFYSNITKSQTKRIKYTIKPESDLEDFMMGSASVTDRACLSVVPEPCCWGIFGVWMYLQMNVDQCLVRNFKVHTQFYSIIKQYNKHANPFKTTEGFEVKKQWTVTGTVLITTFLLFFSKFIAIYKENWPW